MVKALACRVEGPGFKSDHGKSFGKKKKKKASYPLLAWWKSGWRECSPTRKKGRVCAIMSIWLVHIKEHVWTIGTCPTTILLSTITMCECVCEWQHWRLVKKRICGTWDLRTCMLPRELIWERVAPSHTGVTQLSDWPELQAMWSAPESPHKARAVHYINDVSLSLK